MTNVEAFDVAGIRPGRVVSLPLPGVPSTVEVADGTQVPVANTIGRFRVVAVTATTMTVEGISP